MLMIMHQWLFESFWDLLLALKTSYLDLREKVAKRSGPLEDIPGLLYAGVGGKTSPLTMAAYKQFGNAFQHEPQTASATLAQLIKIESMIDPWDLTTYLSEAKWFHLNGVHCPFWRDWPLAEPSLFLTPELLHHWHKYFWDHDTKWCIWAVRAVEIDFWFSVL